LEPSTDEGSILGWRKRPVNFHKTVEGLGGQRGCGVLWATGLIFGSALPQSLGIVNLPY